MVGFCHGTAGDGDDRQGNGACSGNGVGPPYMLAQVVKMGCPPRDQAALHIERAFPAA
jgi:hypothetical protein